MSTFGSMQSTDRQIIRLAIPNIVSNITIPLVGLVDTWLVGHLDNPNYIGAVALGSVIFMFLYSGFGFLRASTTGFTAQAYGARRLDEAITVLGRGLLVAGFGALLILLFQLPLKNLAFSLMSGSDEMEKLAVTYFSVRIWAAPAALANYVLTGWFIGMQNSKSPMIVAIVVNVFNVIFSAYFILFRGMTTDGVALGTVIAQYSGLLTSLILFMIYYRKLLKYWSFRLITSLKGLVIFMQVNKDILIRSLLLTGTFFYFTTFSAGLGDDYINLNSLMLQFLWILSYLVDGFAYAAESLVGKAVGAKNEPFLKHLIRRVFFISFVITAFITLLYLFFYDDLFSLLTSQASLKPLLEQHKFWIWLMPGIAFAAFVWDGIYIGALASVKLRNAMIVSSLLVFLPLIHWLPGVLGNHGSWLALLAFLLARGAMLTFFAPDMIRAARPKLSNSFD